LAKATTTKTTTDTQNNVVPINTETKPDKPSRGRGGKDNFPTSRAGVIQTEEDRQFVKKLLGEVLTEYTRPRVKNDEELQNRLNEYFEHCAITGQLPTVEEMMLSTGFSYWYMYDIEVGRRKGFSPETAQILKKAKAFLMTFDAKLAVTGKMNFLAYCFRAKNYYGMVDKQEHVITPNTTEETEYSREDLMKRYIQDNSAPIETTAEDV
jgi:hypothetical protein